MLAEEPTIFRGETVCRGRSWAERVAKAGKGRALEIDAGEQRCGNALLAVAQQSPGLVCGLYVAREQDHARRLQSLEQGSEARRHLCAVKADDQKLADLREDAHEIAPSRSAVGIRGITDHNHLPLTKTTIIRPTILSQLPPVAAICLRGDVALRLAMMNCF